MSKYSLPSEKIVVFLQLEKQKEMNEKKARHIEDNQE